MIPLTPYIIGLLIELNPIKFIFSVAYREHFIHKQGKRATAWLLIAWAVIIIITGCIFIFIYPFILAYMANLITP